MEEEQMMELIPFLKERGLRITPQRMLILSTIQKLNIHPTVEDSIENYPILVWQRSITMLNYSFNYVF